MYSIYRALDINAVDKYTNHTAIIVGAPVATVPTTVQEVKEQEKVAVEIVEPAESVEEKVNTAVSAEVEVKEKPVKKSTRKKSKE